MRHLARLAASAALLLLAGNALALNSANGPTRTIFTNLRLAAGGSDGCFQWSATGIDVPAMGNGILAIRAICSTGSVAADTTAADSLAFEVFLFADALPGADTTAFAPVPMDDSAPRLSGWFCTTQDSTNLTLDGNLTPLNLGWKYPTYVSRRVVFGTGQKKAGSTAIPGWPFLRYGGATVGASVYPGTRMFFLSLNDAYGGALRGYRKMTVGILNRHPRVGCFVSAYLLPASD